MKKIGFYNTNANFNPIIVLFSSLYIVPLSCQNQNNFNPIIVLFSSLLSKPVCTALLEFQSYYSLIFIPHHSIFISEKSNFNPIIVLFSSRIHK